MTLENFALRALSALSGQRLILPFYSAVSNIPLAHLSFINRVKDSSCFEKDLQLLLKNYDPIAAEDLLHIKKISKYSFHLSFDGGYSQIYNTVAPILKKYGVPATFFINPAFIDNKDLMFRCKASLIIHDMHSRNWANDTLHEVANKLGVDADKKQIQKALLAIGFKSSVHLDEIAQMIGFSFERYLDDFQPYLTTEQIIELSDDGFTIGSHSNTHPLFSEIDLPGQIMQINDSLRWIHERINQHIRLFSFPFTDDGIDISFYNSINQQICPPVDLIFGTAGMKNEISPFHYQRINAEKYKGSISKVFFEQYIKYIAKAPLMRNLSKR